MSGSDTERTYVPAELDALEDAIELRPGVAVQLPAQLGDDARARIHDALLRYRALESLARPLLLSAEPPASVLADVIAQAHAATAERGTAIEIRSASRAAETRSRRWLWWSLPPLATVCAAAAVAVFVIGPSGDPERPSAASSPVIAKAEPPAQAVTAAPPALADASAMPPPAADGRGGGALGLEREEARAIEESAAVTPAELAQGLPAPATIAAGNADTDGSRRARTRQDDAQPSRDAPEERGSDRESDRKQNAEPAAPAKAKKPALPKAATTVPAAPSPSPSSGPAPGSGASEQAMSPADRLERADAARRRGDCGAARPEYEAVIAAGAPKQRAHARAGLSLCLERAGDDAGARALAAKARADDTGIDAWIARER